VKDVKVLGPGCAKCQELLSQTQRAAKEIGLECTVQKVTDIREITSYGIMITPALVVDGQVKVSGKVPSLDDLKKMLM
jgi:small redox-active disulfide protein 2